MTEKTTRQKANAKYNSKCYRKNILLNPVKDKDVIDFIANLPNFTDWVRQKAREEIQKQNDFDIS